jgi:uncharacterized membrane protein
MRKIFTIFALVVLIGGPAAIAQTARRGGSSGGTSDSAATSSDKRGLADAPVGHRQPRASDVRTSDDPMHLNADDAALDRRIKGICRGC